MKKFQLPSSNNLGVAVFLRCLERPLLGKVFRQKNRAFLQTFFKSGTGLCRSASATPGLLVNV